MSSSVDQGRGTNNDGHPTASVHVIDEIKRLPLALENPLYRNYPGMKLGQSHQIDFFSRQLAELAAEILRNTPDSGQHPWVVTAPPYCQLPAAANLMAEQVHRRLLRRGLTTSPVELRLRPREYHVRDAEEFASAHNYSRSNLHQRIRERESVQRRLDTEGLSTRLSGRRVLVINDINVTGTQQRFLQETMDQMQVSASHWLYIFSVDSDLAAARPELEYELNNSQVRDLDSYAAVLNDEQTRHTARCISRFFAEDLDCVRYLTARLSRRAIAQIYRLAQREGRYGAALFEEKMALLADLSASPPT